jgi:ribosome-associated protein
MTFTIPEDEMEIRATRASGPGGQHVNTSATRIEVRWNVLTSPSLTESQRARLLDRLRTRIDRRGFVRVTASARRSQLQNREAAIARLRELVSQALARRKRRKKTKPPTSAREQRLAEKRRRSEIKRDRQPVDRDD